MNTRRGAASLALLVILVFGVISPAPSEAAEAGAVTHGRTIAAERAPARVQVATGEQRHMALLVNDTRSTRGRGPLSLNGKLAQKAQAWAEHLASTGRLAHSELSAGVPSNWQALGENVGYGGTVDGVHRAFMNSSRHRRNLLGRWSQLGTGSATGHGRVYLVYVFMRT